MQKRDAGFLGKFLPDTQDVVLLLKAKVVLLFCVCFALAAWALVLTWLISADLQLETVLAAIVFSVILGVLVWLAKARRVILATWILLGLLFFLIASDVWAYGLGEPAAAAFVLPVILAACNLGLTAGLGVAGAATLLVCWVAWATTRTTGVPISHLTFNAPFYAVIFLITAGPVGVWSQILLKALSAPTEGD